MRDTNAVNPVGFTSIVTKPQRKILVSKSDSGLNALAKEMVVYRALYGKKELWIREKQMFLETIERDGKVQQRFTYIGE